MSTIGDALHDARLGATDIGMIVSHGNGTRLSDATEAMALQRVFGGVMPPVTAFKWAIGHLIAAAGIVETVLALVALRTTSAVSFVGSTAIAEFANAIRMRGAASANAAARVHASA